MNYFIGIDGGGSKTKAILTNPDNKIVATHTGDSCNPTSLGIEHSTKSILDNIESLLQECQISISAVKGICVGTAGAGSQNIAKQFEGILKTDLGTEDLLVTTDAQIALEGAFDGGEGIILIAGTGSILYAKKGGKINRVGGFGKIMGDEGSGYKIGQKTLNEFSKYLDSRKQKDDFYFHLSEYLGIDSTQHLIEKVYKEYFNIASIAGFVVDLANKNETAKMIINNAAVQILELISPIFESKEDSLRIVLSGGLIDKENYYSNLIKNSINSIYPNSEVIDPIFPPEIGAILIAKKHFE
ncbi:MAG: hypothetical protein K9G44_03740 [Melioribacteraceae bacterium]|nr:hypothetical protein [Melioribacteraceae bacterium]